MHFFVAEALHSKKRLVTTMNKVRMDFCADVVEQLQGKKLARPVYVIQEHATKRGTHYDLRLEMNGALESWAIPKNPLLGEKKKLLAIFTAPHAIEYALFHGAIPEGSPGAGTVKIFDRGTYTLKEKTKDKIIFDINGKRLKGGYCLINFKKDGKNWLFFRRS